MSKSAYNERSRLKPRDEKAKEIKKVGLSLGLLEAIIGVIIRYMEPSRIIIFGSRARGDYKKTSDIDIAIDCKDDVGFPSEILDEDIPTLLKFNVVQFRKVNKELRKEIIKEGIVIYEKGHAD